DDHGAADGDKVEVSALHHFDQAVDTRGLRASLPKRRNEVLIEADRADRDCRHAGEFFCPPREIEIAARIRKFRLPEAACRTMEDIHTGVDKGRQEAFQSCRRLRQLRSEVLLLPLRKPQQNWKLRSDFL